MGASQRRKGAQGEREALRLLAQYGIEGDRILEQVRSGGHPDLDTDIGLVEVKRRGEGFKELYRWLEHADFLMLRADRKPWLVVMNAEKFLSLHPDVPAAARSNPSEGVESSGSTERNREPLGASQEEGK